MAMSADYQRMVELVCTTLGGSIVEQAVVNRHSGRVATVISDATFDGSCLVARFAGIDLLKVLGERFTAAGFLQVGPERTAVDCLLAA